MRVNMTKKWCDKKKLLIMPPERSYRQRFNGYSKTLISRHLKKKS